MQKFLLIALIAMGVLFAGCNSPPSNNLYECTDGTFVQDQSKCLQPGPDDKKVVEQGCIDSACVQYLSSSLDKSKTVDVLFIAADSYYGMNGDEFVPKSEKPFIEYDLELFKSDVEKIMDTLFSIEPYDRYKDKFNVYYYTKKAKCYAGDRISCKLGNIPFPDYSPYLEDIGKFDLYIVMENKDGGGLSGAVVLTSNNPGTVAHEISHFFGLADEYQEYLTKGDDKADNTCWDFFCCGGKLCSQEVIAQCNKPEKGWGKCDIGEVAECCIPTAGNSVKYRRPYATLMGAGKPPLVLSEPSIKIVNYYLENWEDQYYFNYEQGLDRDAYVPGYLVNRYYLEDIPD